MKIKEKYLGLLCPFQLQTCTRMDARCLMPKTSTPEEWKKASEAMAGCQFKGKKLGVEDYRKRQQDAE
jgi:hypothetical protein